MAVEGLGTAYAGGWAIDPTGGPNGTPPTSIWGVPVYRDLHWPAASVGTALVGNFRAVDVFVDGEMRIDVSNESGTRWDQNVTGFRAQTQIGFNATPFYLTGHFQKVTGL